VIVEESRAPDIESEIRVSKNIDLSNFKVEPDTQDQGGSSFVGLGDKSTGFENSDGLEIALQDESNFVPNDNMEGHGTFVKMSIFFDREQAADKVGGSITYFFAKHEGQYYVVVQSTSSHKNEIIDNATNKTQAVAEFEDTDEAHKYELGDSISNISFRAKYGEKNTIALKVNGETKTISDIFEHANGKGSINRLRSIWLNGLTTIKGNTLMESLKVSAPLA
ncbi:MAG: hypothetical protein FWF58_02060, partial [Firmicutes bacterium]|nr:hypothetical protein [Bacillota bacterium]